MQDFNGRHGTNLLFKERLKDWKSSVDGYSLENARKEQTNYNKARAIFQVI